MSTGDNLEAVFRIWCEEEDKFGEGNKAAGTRARKALMTMVNLAKLRRKEITDIKNG
jgi:hypothetical protein